jgi:hypothetical protein
MNDREKLMRYNIYWRDRFPKNANNYPLFRFIWKSSLLFWKGYPSQQSLPVNYEVLPIRLKSDGLWNGLTFGGERLRGIDGFMLQRFEWKSITPHHYERILRRSLK